MRTLPLIGALALAVASGAARADDLGPLTLEEAVGYAVAHHPTVQARTAEAAAQGAEVDVARAAYLPQLDASLQVNAGTGNVLRGPLFPVAGVPSVSGPPTGRSLSDVGWGTLAGVGASWNALGLPEQIAEVDAALASEEQARAEVAAERLAVAYGAADQFLDLMSRDEVVRAANASVERARALAKIVDTLVAQQLRPGADGSRAQAELALAVTQLIRAQQAAAVSRATLARALGAAGRTVAIRGDALLLARAVSSGFAPGTKNPLVLEAEAAERTADARQRAVRWQYAPRLDLVGSMWIRGSGLTNGTAAGALPPSPANGLLPDTPNWAVGLVLTWPALEIVATHARSSAAAARGEAARARRTDIEQAIRSQLEVAQKSLAAAQQVAANTPVALTAARAAESQATARYRAGLATVVEVAEADGLLAEAEAEDAVARIDVLRAQLLTARAVGDLEPFFAPLRSGSR
ncbi:MAG TPA: TolC family protein [Polyangia bacterium]|jgi:outer membrane protein TolC|nr:TolC family protein [Polyangia bacterium]